jgi:hypothetical protein
MSQSQLNPAPSLQGQPDNFHNSWFLTILGFQTVGTIAYAFLCREASFTSTLCWRFIHIVYNSSFSCCWILSQCMHILLFAHSLVECHLSCFQIFSIKLLWTFVHSLCVYKYFHFPLSKYPRVKFLCSYGTSMFSFKRIFQIFPLTVLFLLPLTKYESSGCSKSSPTFGAVSFFNCRY